MADFSNKRDRKRLERLRQLCDSLNDRDDQIKKDIQLFEEFFSNFPIPVTMWSISKDHLVLAKRGNAFTTETAATLEEIFKCPVLREQSIEKHEEALLGKSVSYFVQNNNKIYWNKLVPHKTENEDVVGVTGIAWDVTSNSIMLSKLENIVEMTEKDCDIELIREEALHALSASRLRKMLEAEGM